MLAGNDAKSSFFNGCSQSSADLLTLGLAVTSILTGLVWLAIRPKSICVRAIWPTFSLYPGISELPFLPLNTQGHFHGFQDIVSEILEPSFALPASSLLRRQIVIEPNHGVAKRRWSENKEAA
ncbi:hypothetical protein POTOM_037401 [Populus tomentosa]|uniref:Uncharacterized protein n=1 Tax=Populus tomentosa TaxID=118781 RepID=A0A8X8CK41_POPTO|nr:hypothetical protein POTOM_037401 [Populus tomentosa]